MGRQSRICCLKPYFKLSFSSFLLKSSVILELMLVFAFSRAELSIILISHSHSFRNKYKTNEMIM